MTSALLLLLLIAQVSLAAPQTPVKDNRAPVPAQPAPMQEAESAEVDRIFAITFIQAANAEMDLANLAVKRASANEVKGFGEKMIAEHKGMSDEIMPALQHLLKAPQAPRLAPADELAFKHLQAIKPADFDQQYVLTQIAAHLATLTAFQTEAENGTNAALKEIVRKWTPTIQAHLELAVDLAKHVGGASPFKH
jgi:putative membrane protein